MNKKIEEIKADVFALQALKARFEKEFDGIYLRLGVELANKIDDIQRKLIALDTPAPAPELHKNTLVDQAYTGSNVAPKHDLYEEGTVPDRIVFKQGECLLSEFVRFYYLCKQFINRDRYTMYRFENTIKVIPFVCYPKNSHLFAFKVPNDADGWEFVLLARKMLAQGKTMRVRGANIDRTKLIEGEKSSRYWAHVPKRIAKNLRVYINY